MATTHLESGVDDGWPWNCARCGTTIYHDAVHCKACDQQGNGERHPASRFVPATFCRAGVEWIERQTYSSLVATTSAIAAIELLLTALWLRILFLGVSAIPIGVPV